MSRDPEPKQRAIVIPARMESSRFPGKPLVEVNGVPLIVHAAEIAARSDIADYVAVVSDSHEIIAAAKTVPGVLPVPMKGRYRNGTERVAAWARRLPRSSQICIFQCDDPTLTGRDLDYAMALAEDHEVTTVASRAPSSRQICDDDVMLLTTPENQARKVSTVVKFDRGNADFEWHHVGVYIVGNALLQQYAEWPMDPAEELDRLEQLRWQTNGVTISCVHFGHQETESINRPEDVKRVEKVLRGRARGIAAKNVSRVESGRRISTGHAAHSAGG